MKKLFAILCFFLTVFCVDVFAQISRSTTFDDSPTCEKSGGVWREFGNGCVDECRPKLDEFSICTQAVTFGCDCGKGRCWHDGACVTMIDYKKIFDEEQLEDKKKRDAAKEKRKAEARAFEEKRMRILKDQIDKDNKKILGERSLLDIFDKDGNSSESEQVKASPVAQPSEKPIEVPPFFAQKQKEDKERKAAEEAQRLAAEEAKKKQDPNYGVTTIPLIPNNASPNALPDLPVIPLPQ